MQFDGHSRIRNEFELGGGKEIETKDQAGRLSLSLRVREGYTRELKRGERHETLNIEQQ